MAKQRAAAPPGELDARKWRILRAIVTEYVRTGEPVGSKHVVEVAGLDCSPATVRNEMAALEEMGLIEQPHTSAGRIPTDRGYRYFVDHVEPRIDPRQRRTVAEVLADAHDLEDVLRRATNVLAQLTRLVSLVIAPAVDTAKLKLLELVSLSPQAVLVLWVTDTGQVDKRIVELRAPVSEEEVERARVALNEAARGQQVAAVPGLLGRLAEQAPAELRELFDAVAEAAKALEEPTTEELYVGGAAALADRDALGRRELSRVLELLEERVTLARILAESSRLDQPLVRIGGEHEVEELQTTALVAQGYRVVSAGSLGVLGPTRMDYARVLSTVRLVADQLQATLQRLSEGERA